MGYTARCIHAAVYGSPSLPGCQAEYFRQPLADGCLFKLDDELEGKGKEEMLKRETLLLLADVLPTGFSAAWNARRLLVGFCSLLISQCKEKHRKQEEKRARKRKKVK